MTHVLYSLNGGGFRHATVDIAPVDDDHAAKLVADQLAAAGTPADGPIRIYRITAA